MQTDPSFKEEPYNQTNIDVDLSNNYQVLVDNIGQVIETNRKKEALSYYKEYVSLSKDNIGRAGNENVYLIENNEVLHSHHAKLSL